MKTTELISEVERALTDRRIWEQKRRLHYSKRYGLRNEKVFPWKGCSNLRIPLTDKILRRISPALKSSVFSVTPVVTVEPFGDMPATAARNMEHGYDWLLRYRMRRSREELQYAHDNCIAYGIGLMKVCWHYESEIETRKIDVDFVDPNIDRKVVPLQELSLEIATRFAVDPIENREQINSVIQQFLDGAEELSIQIENVIYDAPRWYFVDAMDCLVPWDSGTDVDRLPWIGHRCRMTRRELQVSIKHAGFDPKNTKLVIDGLENFSNRQEDELDTRRNMREGIGGDTKKSSTAEIWEIHYFADKDGDGVDEKHVLTWSADKKLELRDIPYEYEHGQWPYTYFSFEANEPRWYSSRGVVEMLLDLQTEIDTQHNAKLDNMAIRNTVSFIYRAGSIKDKQWRFSPGAMFPTQRGPQDASPLSFQPMDYSSNSEEESLRAWSEEYIGTPDFGISNINQRVERRTATEVDQISQSSGAIAAEFLERTQESHRRLHRQTMLLWAQYGKDNVMVRVTGQPAPVPFSRFDLRKDYNLVPTGRLDNLTPNMRLQRAGVALDLARDQVTGPFVRTYEVVREIFENLDYHNAERFINEPGNFDQEAKARQTAEIAQMAILQEVHPVDQRDLHQQHAEVCAAALSNGANQEAAPFIAAHMALHMFFLGQKQQFQQLLQEGWQPAQAGTKVTLIPPQPQQQEMAVPA
jgi:hypothetical protein